MKSKLTKVGLVLGLLALIVVPAALAQSGNTWTVNFFPNLDWAGSPASTQFVPALNYNWGLNAPASNMPADNWTLRATTTANFTEGVNRFQLLADDEVVFILDGITYLDTRGQGLSGKTLIVDIPLSGGSHWMQVDFREFTQNAVLFLSWSLVKPGEGGGTGDDGTNPNYPGVPALPPSQSSVVTRFGDYTPCIQQNIHQANCFTSDGAWNSPNLGSIQMEPQITTWTNCTADAWQQFIVDPTLPPVSFKCSKTEAGWFRG